MLRLLRVLLLLGFAGLASCSNLKRAADVGSLALLPSEVPTECKLRFGAKPMVMRPASEAGRKNAEVILGFWFGRGHVPHDDIEVAVSNILATDTDDFALTMIATRFSTPEAASRARALLRPSTSQTLIETQGRHLIMFSSGESLSQECTQRAAELLMAKVAASDDGPK